jgi:ribosomal protein S27E
MQNAPEINRENVRRFSCERCGANVVFDARVGKLQCSFCGHAQEIETSGAVEERFFEEFLQKGMRDLQPMARDAMQVGCDGCGAIVYFTPPETAASCGFCGAKIIAQPKSADPLIAPEGILPFSITGAQAREHYKKWLSSRRFAPSRLKRLAQDGSLSSVYIPYWTYDAFTQSRYTGERGVSHHTIKTVTVNGKTQPRAVSEIKWSPASGSVVRMFDDVCVPATRSLPPQYLDKLEPWDLHELKPFEPAYLSGHKAQTYQIPLDEGFKFFKNFVYKPIEADALKHIGGDKQRVEKIDTEYSAVNFKHLLLPVYVGAYQFKGKVFQIVINGRTGEVQGDRPFSYVKIISLFIIGLILLFVIGLALGRLMILFSEM